MILYDGTFSRIYPYIRKMKNTIMKIISFAVVMLLTLSTLLGPGMLVYDSLLGKDLGLDTHPALYYTAACCLFFNIVLVAGARYAGGTSLTLKTRDKIFAAISFAAFIFISIIYFSEAGDIGTLIFGIAMILLNIISFYFVFLGPGLLTGMAEKINYPMGEDI